MLERIEPDPEGKSDPWTELANLLGVPGWRTPGRKPIRYEREPGAPAWWSGDEEASSTFLRGVGVNL